MTHAPKPGRLACCVPFCRRTTRADRWPGSLEWICAPHWRHVSRDKKVAQKALRKEHEGIRSEIEAASSAGDGIGLDAAFARRGEAFDRSDALWERCRAEAVEAGAGIG